MPNRARFHLAALMAILSGATLAGPAFSADAAVPGNASRGRLPRYLTPPPLPEAGRYGSWTDPSETAGRPARRINGGPGYVGSDFGLGKPAFTGLGTRPDWGRSE